MAGVPISAMLDDPYSGMPGVEELSPETYRVTTRAVTRKGIRQVALKQLGAERPVKAPAVAREV